MKQGLVIYKGRAMYGHCHGLLLPEPLLRLVVRLWNQIACRVIGHDDVLWHLTQADARYAPATCTACLAPLTACTGNHHKKAY